MKFLIIKNKRIIQFVAFNYLLIQILGCGSVDNFDAETFSIFGNENNSKDGFRRYTLNDFNEEPMVLFVLDKSDEESVRFDGNLRKICDYTKFPYQSISMEKWDSLAIIPKTTRVLCMAGTPKLSTKSIAAITDFVAKGGTFFLPIATEDKRLGYLLGFKVDANYNTDISSKGFYFKTEMLPGIKEFKINKKERHYGFDKSNFSNKIKILAVSISDPTYPTMIENRIGKGRVILYNTRKSFEKRDRGLLFSGLLKGLEGVPYPIANTSTIFLDDFPCPLFDTKSEPIASEMNLSSTEYVKKIWWPDMLKLANKYNISYSVMLTFDYKNNVQPPFIFDQWNTHKIKVNSKYESLSDWFVYDAAKNGHELAFHGFNHVELLKNLWTNQDFIETSLKTVEKKWNLSDFGKLPVTYVPPSNYIDQAGILQLKNTLPSLKYLCSIFNGSKKNGGDREFDFDPYSKDFFDYPRISSGFYFSPEEETDMRSAFLYTGIWTHFLHPDDVYQLNNIKSNLDDEFDYRNSRNLGWYKTKGKNIGMFPEFDYFLKNLTTNYPQIRFFNTSEAAEYVIDWRASNFKHTSENGVFSVTELEPEKSKTMDEYWFLYVTNENQKKIENSFQKNVKKFSKTPYLDGYLYTIHTDNSSLNIIDLEYKSELQSKFDSQLAAKINNEYLDFEQKVKHFNDIEKGNSVANEISQQEQIDLLLKKIDSETQIDPTTWNLFAQYMNWEERGEEVWQKLENYCIKYPLPENIMYSRILNTIIEYPNDIIREKWLKSQLLIHPDDKELVYAYLDSFDSPNNEQLIREAILNLLKTDTSFDTHFLYIQHLLMYDQKNAYLELKKIAPNEKYRALATDIAWLFADNGNYEKAYDWSFYSDSIDFSSKASWLVEMKSFKLLESEYTKYIQNHNDDIATKATMSQVYYETGRFKEAWILANSLPIGTEKDALKVILNKDVLYVDTELQLDLIKNYPELFYPDILNELIKLNRKENGNFVSLASSLESNKKDASAMKNSLSYNFYNKKGSLHSISATFSKMYQLNSEIIDPDNVTHSVFGIQYQYDNPKKVEKMQYWTRFRTEYSDFGNYYFQFGAGANVSKNKWYHSAEFRVFPAESGPSYSKNIYRFVGNLYQDGTIFKALNVSLSLEANFYTASKSSAVSEIGESYEASATGKIVLDNGKEKSFKFLPFIELSDSQAVIGNATVKPASGYPYWMIPSRFYAGGGLGWKVGKTENNFNSRVEAGWFYDNYSDNFKRFVGEIAYQIFDYTALSLSFEIYSQSEFYSDVIQFGLKYNFKKKQKK